MARKGKLIRVIVNFILPLIWIITDVFSEPQWLIADDVHSFFYLVVYYAMLLANKKSGQSSAESNGEIRPTFSRPDISHIAISHLIGFCDSKLAIKVMHVPDRRVGVCMSAMGNLPGPVFFFLSGHRYCYEMKNFASVQVTQIQCAATLRDVLLKGLDQ